MLHEKLDLFNDHLLDFEYVGTQIDASDSMEDYLCIGKDNHYYICKSL